LGLLSFMVLLHGGMLTMSLLILAARHNHWTVRRLWQPHPTRSPA
jgi:lipopolysaccharide export system permease protein